MGGLRRIVKLNSNIKQTLQKFILSIKIKIKARETILFITREHSSVMRTDFNGHH